MRIMYKQEVELFEASAMTLLEGFVIETQKSQCVDEIIAQPGTKLRYKETASRKRALTVDTGGPNDIEQVLGLEQDRGCGDGPVLIS